MYDKLQSQILQTYLNKGHFDKDNWLIRFWKHGMDKIEIYAIYPVVSNSLLTLLFDALHR